MNNWGKKSTVDRKPTQMQNWGNSNMSDIFQLLLNIFCWNKTYLINSDHWSLYLKVQYTLHVYFHINILVIAIALQLLAIAF